MADAVFRTGDLVDEGPENGLATDLPTARASFALASCLFQRAGQRGRVAECSARLAYVVLHSCPGDGHSLLGLDWPALRPAIEAAFAHGVSNPFLASLMARAHAEGVAGVPADAAAALVWAQLALAPGACDPAHAAVQKDALISVAAITEYFAKAAPEGKVGGGGGGGSSRGSGSGSGSGSGKKSKQAQAQALPPLKPPVAALLQGMLASLRGLADSAAWAGSHVAAFALWQMHRVHKLLGARAVDEEDRDMQHGADVGVLEALAASEKECSGCAAVSLYVAYRDGALGCERNTKKMLAWQARALQLSHELPPEGQAHACDA